MSIISKFKLFPTERIDTYAIEDKFFIHKFGSFSKEIKFYSDSIIPCNKCELNLDYPFNFKIDLSKFNYFYHKETKIPCIKLNIYDLQKEFESLDIQVSSLLISHLYNLLKPLPIFSKAAIEQKRNISKEKIEIYLESIIKKLSEASIIKNLILIDVKAKDNDKTKLNFIRNYLTQLSYDITQLKRLYRETIKEYKRASYKRNFCSGVPIFYDRQCPKGHDSNTRKKDIHLEQHIFIENLINSKYSILAFDKNYNNFYIPTPNCYKNGAICLGNYSSFSGHLIYNYFWESFFNDDLSGNVNADVSIKKSYGDDFRTIYNSKASFSEHEELCEIIKTEIINWLNDDYSNITKGKILDKNIVGVSKEYNSYIHIDENDFYFKDIEKNKRIPINVFKEEDEFYFKLERLPDNE